MLTLVVLANVVAYMVNPTLGFVLTSATVLVILSRPGRAPLDKLITALVITMPMYAIPIIDGLHHIFSWSTFLLFMLTIYAAAHVQRISSIAFVTVLPIVAFTIATHFLNDNAGEGAYYIIQFLLFVLPLVVVYSCRDWVATVIDRDAAQRLLRTLASTLIACALGVFIQAFVHTTTGNIIGSVSFFRNRVSYDLTMNAYSVLSVILSVGLVLAPSLFRRGLWLQGTMLIVFCGGAILVNTSRSGLVIGSLVLLISLLFPPAGINRILPRLALIPAAGFVYWLYKSYAASARGTRSLFDDNGRATTYDQALATIGSDLPTLLLGIGYNSVAYTSMSPHNFLLETVLRSGLIVSIAFATLAIGLLKFLSRTEWQYSVWVFLGGGMLFAGLYAVKAAVIVTVVMVVLGAASQSHGHGGATNAIVRRARAGAAGTSRPLRG